MKKLFSILFFIACCACGKTDRIFDIDTKLCPKALTSIQLIGEELPIEALGGYGLKVFDSLLVITTAHPDHFRDVYGTKSYSLLAEILKKGRAKKEFLFAGYEGQSVKEDGCINLYIQDLNKNVFWKYNLTESVKQKRDCGVFVCQLPRSYLGAYYLSPDIFCYQNFVSNKGCSYVVKNIKKDEVIEEFSVINFMKNQENIDIPISNYITKDNNVIICYSRKIDQLMFINIKDKTKISVSTSDVEPTWSRLKADYGDESKLYYDYVAATEKEIYALYKGNPSELQIHCFSQTGIFFKKMILKEKIIAFDISESFIYGLTVDEKIYKYKI